MAHQEYFTRTDGFKFVLRQSNDGRWSVKCLRPPSPDQAQWEVVWECDGTVPQVDKPINGEYVPFDETRARATYEGYMG